MSIPVRSRRLHYHVADANTVGLWQGFGDKTDSSGNNLTLTLGGGTERYGEIGHGLQGFLFDGSTYYKRTSNDAVLNLVGDMTIEAIIRPITQPSGLDSAVVVTYGLSGVEVGNNDNNLWEMAAGDATVGGNPAMAGVVSNSFFWETGAGTNNVRTSTVLGLLNEPQHWSWVRTGTTLIPYLNGYAQPSFTGITLGTLGGAPAQLLGIGGTDAGTAKFTGVIASVKISNVARSADYILRDALRTLGIASNLRNAGQVG